MIRVETEGETRVERLLWTVMLGDLVSMQLAAHGGVDPAPIELIDRLKEELGRPVARPAFAARGPRTAGDASP